MALEERGVRFITPNLTPADGGVLSGMSEEAFVARFRHGDAQVGSGSPMPWGAYARTAQTDLAAIFRYLESLPPSETPG
jgi:hypothetical protein